MLLVLIKENRLAKKDSFHILLVVRRLVFFVASPRSLCTVSVVSCDIGQFHHIFPTNRISYLNSTTTPRKKGGQNKNNIQQ